MNLIFFIINQVFTILNGIKLYSEIYSNGEKLINLLCPSIMSHRKIWKVFEKSNFPKSIDHAGMITYRDTRINHRE